MNHHSQNKGAANEQGRQPQQGQPQGQQPGQQQAGASGMGLGEDRTRAPEGGRSDLGQPDQQSDRDYRQTDTGIGEDGGADTGERNEWNRGERQAEQGEGARRRQRHDEERDPGIGTNGE